MRKLLRALWRSTFGAVHQTLFRRYFQAMLSRQETTLAQFGTLRTQVQDLKRTVDSDVARLEALALQVRDLDVQVRNALAARWDDAALARRMTSLEDRLSAGARADESPDATDSGTDAGVQTP